MISPSKIFSSLVILLLVCGSSLAQEAARPDRGAALNRNYLTSDTENISLQNGNVQLSTRSPHFHRSPAANSPGRSAPITTARSGTCFACRKNRWRRRGCPMW